MRPDLYTLAKEKAQFYAEILPPLFAPSFHLKSYQQEGVRTLISRLLHPTRALPAALLGDEQGLGKTVTALTLSALLHPGVKTVIVCPASLRHVWKNEIETKLSSHLNFSPYIVAEAQAKWPLTATHYILSYNLFHKPLTRKRLSALRGCFFIVDEAHRIKNLESKASRSVSAYSKTCAFKTLLLSGTFFAERSFDLYAALKLAHPDHACTRTPGHFGRTFCELIPPSTFNPRPTFGTGSTEQTKKLSNFVFSDTNTRCALRRVKEDVAKELPPKTFQTIPIEVPGVSLTELLDPDTSPLTPEQQNFGRLLIKAKNYQRLYTFLASALTAHPELKEKGLSFNKSMASSWSKVGLLKVPSILEILSSELESACNPIVLFLHHKKVIGALSDALSRQEISHGIISGFLNSVVWPIPDGVLAHDYGDMDARSRVVKEFQKGNLRVLLAQDNAASEGLTLTASDTLIFGEVPMSRVVYSQAQDRIHRIGTKHKSLRVIALKAINTIDEILVRLLDEKSLASEDFYV